MDSASPAHNPQLQSVLLNTAKALDDGAPRDALASLRQLPLATGDTAARLVALALWKRMALLTESAGPSGRPDTEATLAALGDLGAFVTDEKYVWTAYRALTKLEKLIGSADAATAVAGILWDRILTAHEGFFVAAMGLFFRGGDIARCREAWRQFLAARKDHVPGYWDFLLYCKTQPKNDRASVAADVESMLKATGRQDLAQLIAVYLLQMRQADCTEVRTAAAQLKAPAHRARVGEYMTGFGYMPKDLPIAVATHRELTSDLAQSAPALSFMAARAANAEGRWREVLTSAEQASASPHHGQAAQLLAANALGQMGHYEQAREKLAAAVAAPDTPDYLKARAAFIRVTIERAAKGLPAPERTEPPQFEATPGRPLAQSLWVGRRLRWIEQLAIQSYLDNGWRFQLYAYDEIENAPEGCEVLDASAIIPSKDVFKEGFGSGLHAGSVGAFSDLFRYRLLHERGGLWTDTDVINIKRYDPDGHRFISTEISDAGLITLNGAIMAAPSGDAFMARAYERAAQLIKADGVFFTRIGPYLLAELLVEAGVETMTLMPPAFLSAVFWMNTADLLRPYDDIMRRLEEQKVVNLHVYTEMWRMLGLGLDRPPDGATFLGRLYEERFGRDTSGARS